MADFPQDEVLSANEAIHAFTGKIPILYEDDGPKMGESHLHTRLAFDLHWGLRSYLRSMADYQVFCNMNLYYPVKGDDETSLLPYVSPDIMIVRPFKQLPKSVECYRLFSDGPAPVVALEILSERTAREIDLSIKVILYRVFGVREYILVDILGDFLPQRLVVKRLRCDQTWEDVQDPDGGVTSLMGFRLVFASDQRLRVVNAETGYRYLGMDEMVQMSLVDAARHAQNQAEAELQAAIDARNRAQDRVREVEAELSRLLGERPLE